MELMLAHHPVGRSPEPSPCGDAAGYDVRGLATNVASLRRASRSEAPKHLGMGENPTTLGRSVRSMSPVARAVSQARPQQPDKFSRSFSLLLYPGRATRPGAAAPPDA